MDIAVQKSNLDISGNLNRISANAAELKMQFSAFNGYE